MLMYALIGLSLVLVGIVGLQFTYLFYADKLYQERKKYLQTLEQKHAEVTRRLDIAEHLIAEQNARLEAVYLAPGKQDDAWAKVIEDH